MSKMTPYLMALAHYHENHGGHAGSYTGFWAADDILEFPDVYVVSDPKARARFRALADEIRAGESKAVKELRRMMKLPDPEPTARPEPAPGKRRAAAK
jgi:hypothetical protein